MTLQDKRKGLLELISYYKIISKFNSEIKLLIEFDPQSEKFLSESGIKVKTILVDNQYYTQLN